MKNRIECLPRLAPDAGAPRALNPPSSATKRTSHVLPTRAQKLPTMALPRASQSPIRPLWPFATRRDKQPVCRRLSRPKGASLLSQSPSPRSMFPGATPAERVIPTLSSDAPLPAHWLQSANFLVLRTSPAHRAGFPGGRIPRPLPYPCGPSSPPACRPRGPMCASQHCKTPRGRPLRLELYSVARGLRRALTVAPLSLATLAHCCALSSPPCSRRRTLARSPPGGFAPPQSKAGTCGICSASPCPCRPMLLPFPE